MIARPAASVVVLLCLLQPSLISRAQDQTRPSAKEQGQQLHERFNDDFSKDSRGEYAIEGDVSWHAGNLILAEKASVARKVASGACAKVELELAGRGLGETEKSELRIWFSFRIASPCFVRLRRQADGGMETTTAALVVVEQQDDGQIQHRVIRELPVAKLTSNALTIGYRYGLVTVASQADPILIASVRNSSAPIVECRVESGMSPLRIDQFACATIDLPQKQPTIDETKSVSQQFQGFVKEYRDGDLATAGKLAEELLKSARKVYGKQSHQEANILDNLAVMYVQLRLFERAEPLIRQAMKIKLSLLGAQHPDYAFSLRNLAELHYRQRAFAAAEPLFQQVLKTREQVFGRNHADYIETVRSLARLYQDSGDHSRAKSYYVQALELIKSLHGEQHIEYVRRLGELADVTRLMDDLPQAEAMFRKAVGIRQGLRRGADVSDANLLNDFAILLDRLGKHSQAEQLYLQSLRIKKATLGDQHSSYAVTLRNLASHHLAKGDYRQARLLAMQASKSLQGAKGAELVYAQGLATLGEANSKLGQHAQAVQILETALKVMVEALGANHPKALVSASSLAAAYAKAGDYARAEALFNKTAELQKELPNEKVRYASTLLSMGSLYQLRGAYDRAEANFKAALAIQKTELGTRHPRYAKTMNSLGRLYSSLGDYERAERLYRNALEIMSEALGKQNPDYANCLGNIAGVHLARQELDQAKQLYKQAAEIERAVLGEKHPSYAVSLRNLGSVYLSQGELEQARPLLETARTIIKSALGEEHFAYADCAGSLGDLYARMGDYANAEPLLKQAVEIQKSAAGESSLRYAEKLNRLGLLYYRMDRHAEAERLYRRALAVERVLEAKGWPKSAATRNNLAGLYRRTGDFANAERLHKEATEIVKQTFGETHVHYAVSLNNLGLLYIEMGDFVQAETACKAAREVLRDTVGEQHHHYATTLFNLSECFAAPDQNSTRLKLLREALEIQRFLLDRNSLVQSQREQYSNQAEGRFFLDRRLSASNDVEGGEKSALEDVWRWKGAVTARQQAYRRVAARPQLAPLFAELQAVSRELSAVAGRAPTPPRQTAPEASIIAYKKRRTKWQAEFSELNRRQESLEQKIAAGSEDFRRVREPIRLDQVQEWLPQETAYVDFLEYVQQTFTPEEADKYRYERRFVAFVVRTDSEPIMVRLGAASALAEAIEEFRRPFQPRLNTLANRRVAEEAGRRIRRDLWSPIERHLEGVKTVILSPDTVLGTLPFAALPGRSPGRYLLEEYRLAFVPSVQRLRPAPRDPESQEERGLLVLGDVHYGAERPDGKNQLWKSLPGFAAELEVVRGLYGKQSTVEPTVLSGEEATEQRFLEQAGDSRLLHVVTHGYFEDPSVQSIQQVTTEPRSLSVANNEGPDPFLKAWTPGLLSGLVLAGANAGGNDIRSNSDDGILRASEIEAASLGDVDLVVLSACETGLGAVAGGEGLTGLQRAFQVAGARTVLASLWKVDDDATLALMTEFYRNLWEKKMSKLDALRAAQLTLLNHYNPESGELRGLGSASVKVDASKPLPAKQAGARLAPRYWAAFQLSGDWR